MATKVKLTDARARAFAPVPGREAVLWDAVVRGFGLRVRPHGGKSWVVHRRQGDGVLKRTLGPLDALTTDEARGAARTLLDGAAASNGSAATAPTLQAFGPMFLADCAHRWKPATRVSHAHGLRTRILPAFGTPRVDAIRAPGRPCLVRRSGAARSGDGQPGAGGAVVADATR